MPLLTVSKLTIDGVVMPAPKAPGGMKIKEEKIWSQNTGRTAAATMVGTILAIKRTVDISWPPLTVEQVNVIEAAVSDRTKPFSLMSYTDQTGIRHAMNVYFGTPSYSCFAWIKGQWKVTDVTVSAIEQ